MGERVYANTVVCMRVWVLACMYVCMYEHANLVLKVREHALVLLHRLLSVALVRRLEVGLCGWVSECV